MKRKEFLGAAAAGAASLWAADPQRKTRFYILEYYHLKNGTQSARLHEFLRSALPIARRFHSGPRLYLEAIVAPHMPQVATIAGYEKLEDYFQLRARLHDVPEFNKMVTKWETGEEPAFEQHENMILEATNYSPEIGAPAKAPRIFELRVYHSPTYRQLNLLHERFAGPEIKIFHRVGVHPILYTSTLVGPNRPNLTYVIPFDDLGAREKAWNAFAADPEWIKVRKESIDKGGQISSVIQIALFKATDYSPIK